MEAPVASEQEQQAVPLCVDLDGTLVRTDTLIESALLLVKRNPLNIFSLLLWLFAGKATLKQNLANRVAPDAAALPYNEALIDWLQARRDEGRELVLVTAANIRIARAVADHLAIFSDVIASSSERNLSRATKRDELVARYGQGGFDYAGNSDDDLPVWEGAREAIVVNASDATAQAARARAKVTVQLPPRVSPWRALLKAMRPHQWSKNVLVFVTIVVDETYGDGALLLATLVAFVAFCLCSSAVYLINDMLDLSADRRHSKKCQRPFASGDAPLVFGVVGAPVLLVVAFALATAASGPFVAALALYFMMTLGYSLFLKRHAMIDVLVLAMLYTMRIIAGAAVAGSMASIWLLSFSMFLFASLAMAKRYAELKSLERSEGAWAGGRGYHVDDLAIVAQLGSAAGYVSILVLALYIDSPELNENYTRQGVMWLLCPLLMYWIGRLWLIASRGDLHEDPVIFAARDRVSYVVVLLGVIALWAAH